MTVAVPATEAARRLVLVVLRSGSLSSAILADRLHRDLPTLFLLGSPEPFSILAALVSQIEPAASWCHE